MNVDLPDVDSWKDVAYELSLAIALALIGFLTWLGRTLVHNFIEHRKESDKIQKEHGTRLDKHGWEIQNLSQRTDRLEDRVEGVPEKERMGHHPPSIGGDGAG